MEYVRAFISLFDMHGERIIIVLLCVAVIYLYRKVGIVEHKFTQIDKLVFAHGLIINTKLGIRTVKMHRNNDYEVAQPINVTKN